MTNSFWDHPISTIEKALALRKRIEALKDSVSSILGGGSTAGNGKVSKRRGRPPKAVVTASATSVVDGRKGKRSAATIAKMKAAQKARWAKKAGATSSAEPTPKKKKRTMSPEARARIAAAQKARWAKFRKA